MSKKIKTTLGKGLDSMLGGEALASLTTISVPQSEGGASIAMLSIERIQPNPNQPRRSFTEESLSELAESLKHLGVIQPITVQHLSNGDYQIISGERRYRAALQAGLKELPAYVREISDNELLELALVENIQREDLTAIEIALAYQGLIEQTGATQEAIAQRVGKNKSSISNYLRLLRLPAEIQLGLSQRQLEMGHARALLHIEDTERQIELYHLIVSEGMSVREVEDLARAIQAGVSTNEEPVAHKLVDNARNTESNAFHQLEEHLRKVFGTKVRFRYGAKGKGSINIPFANEEDLDRLIALLQKIQA